MHRSEMGPRKGWTSGSPFLVLSVKFYQHMAMPVIPQGALAVVLFGCGAGQLQLGLLVTQSTRFPRKVSPRCKQEHTRWSQPSSGLGPQGKELPGQNACDSGLCPTSLSSQYSGSEG